MRRGWFFVLLLGCAHPQVAPRPAPKALNEMLMPRPAWWSGHEYRRIRLRFLGAEQVRVSEIAYELRSRYGDVDANVLAYDQLVVLGWYLDHGYVAAQVEVGAAALGDELTVTFSIHEGSVYRVAALDVREEDERPALGWKPPFATGEVFGRSALSRALDRVRRHYRDLGYASMKADPQTEIDDVRHLISIRVRVQRGPLTYFEQIGFSGLTTIPFKSAAEQLLVKRGDRYNETALEDSKKKLLDTAWFTRVELAILPGSKPELVKLAIEVDERPKSSPGVFTLR